MRFVVNTHYHADHSYGNTVFAEAGAVIVCSEDCASEALNKGSADVANQAKGSKEPIVYPGLRFDVRMAFDDGQRRIDLVKVGPAHTRGDVVAYLPKEQILFVGDLAVNWTHGNNVSDPDADLVNWIAVLDKLASWDATTVVPAHGAIATRELLPRQRRYFADLLAAVYGGIAAGKSAAQVANETNLSQHQPFGADRTQTADQLKTVYRALRARAAARP